MRNLYINDRHAFCKLSLALFLVLSGPLLFANAVIRSLSTPGAEGAVTFNLSMPVSFVGFTARTLEGGMVLLDWSTDSEKENDLFDIESSSDGRIFEKVGQVKGLGNPSSGTNHYEFTHDTEDQSGTMYYRVKQVHMDGALTYSAILALRLLGAGRITVSPNPVNDRIIIRGVSKKWKVEVCSVNGKQLLEVQNQKEIDIRKFPIGMYVVKVTMEGRKPLIKKVVKE